MAFLEILPTEFPFFLLGRGPPLGLEFMGPHLSSILIWEYYGTQYRVRLYPPLGIVSYIRNIILLGLTTKKDYSFWEIPHGTLRLAPVDMLPSFAVAVPLAADAGLLGSWAPILNTKS